VETNWGSGISVLIMFVSLSVWLSSDDSTPFTLRGLVVITCGNARFQVVRSLRTPAVDQRAFSTLFNEIDSAYEGWNPDVVRTIHGYDAAVIQKRARASSSL